MRHNITRYCPQHNNFESKTSVTLRVRVRVWNTLSSRKIPIARPHRRAMGFFVSYLEKSDSGYPERTLSGKMMITLQCRHKERNGVSNHQPQDYLFNRLFRRRSKKTSKLRVTGLCEGNWPVSGEFPAQMTSKAENASICWRHHEIAKVYNKPNCIYLRPSKIRFQKED